MKRALKALFAATLILIAIMLLVLLVAWLISYHPFVFAVIVGLLIFSMITVSIYDELD